MIAYYDPYENLRNSAVLRPWYEYMGIDWPNNELSSAKDKHGDWNFAPLYNSKARWFNSLDDMLVFEMDIPGFSKKEISVKIENLDYSKLIVDGKKEKKSFSETYEVPEDYPIDYENVSSKVEDGLLTVNLPIKKVAKKTIQVL